MPARVVALVPDLLIGSRIDEAARRIQADLESISSQLQLEASLDRPADLLVLDLAVRGIDLDRIVALARAANVPIVAFGPHVDTDLFDAAREAGISAVYPRSSFLKNLSRILADLRHRT